MGHSELDGFHLAKPAIAGGGSPAGLDIGVARCRHERASEVHARAAPARRADASSRARGRLRGLTARPSQTMAVAHISDGEDGPVYDRSRDPRRQADGAELPRSGTPWDPGAPRARSGALSHSSFWYRPVSDKPYPRAVPPVVSLLPDRAPYPAISCWTRRQGHTTTVVFSPGDRPVPAAGAREAIMRWRQGRLPRRYSFGVIDV